MKRLYRIEFTSFEWGIPSRLADSNHEIGEGIVYISPIKAITALYKRVNCIKNEANRLGLTLEKESIFPRPIGDGHSFKFKELNFPIQCYISMLELDESDD